METDLVKMKCFWYPWVLSFFISQCVYANWNKRNVANCIIDKDSAPPRRAPLECQFYNKLQDYIMGNMKIFSMVDFSATLMAAQNWKLCNICVCVCVCVLVKTVFAYIRQFRKDLNAKIHGRKRTNTHNFSETQL